MRQRSDNVFRNSVRKELLLRVATHIDERQNRNRRLVRQERRGGRRFGCLRRATGHDPIDMHRLGDVLDLLLAEIGEGERQFVSDLVAHRA